MKVGDRVFVKNVSGWGDNSYFGTIVKLDGDAKVKDESGKIKKVSLKNCTIVEVMEQPEESPQEE